MDHVTDVDRVCERHGPYVAKRWVLPGGLEMFSPCPVCREEAKAAKLKADADSAMFEFRLRLAAAGVGARYYDSSFDNYRISCPEAQAAFDVVRDWTREFHPRNSPNLIMYGLTGTGKTHLACAITRDLLLRGFSVSYLPILTLFSQYQDISSYSNRDDGTRESFFSRLRAPDLLIVDEFGITSLTEKEKIVFHRVIDERYNRNVPTCLVGNTDVLDFASIIGERADRRVMANAKIASFEWPGVANDRDLDLFSFLRESEL